MEEYGKMVNNANTTTRKKGLNLVTWQSMICGGDRSLYICPGREGNFSRSPSTIKIAVSHVFWLDHTMENIKANGSREI
jgi:hypothetical protein